MAKNSKKSAAKKASAKPAKPAKKAMAKAAPSKAAPSKAAPSPPAKAAVGKPAPKATAAPAPKPAATKPASAKPAPASAKPAPAGGKPAPAGGKPGPSTASAPPAKPAAASTSMPGKPGTLLSPPLPPRSRLSVREPAEADNLKMKIGALATATNQIRAVKRSIQRSFWDVGNILVDIRDRKLYTAKGYGSFEAFLEREIELGKATSLRLARAVQVFQREPAVAAGMDRVLAAVAAFDGETEPATSTAAVPGRPPRAHQRRPHALAHPVPQAVIRG